jgi:hypothetical protein
MSLYFTSLHFTSLHFTSLHFTDHFLDKLRLVAGARRADSICIKGATVAVTGQILGALSQLTSELKHVETV